MKKIIKTENKTEVKITGKEKQILKYIYKFRFLNTNQLQILFNHKNPKRIQLWLKDLKDNKYIHRYYLPDSFKNRTKPAVYFLGTKGIQILKQEKDCDVEALGKVYKEKSRTESFISYCLDLADVYLFFLAKKKKDEEIRFFTESQLLQYEYFPTPLPSAYISVKTKEKTRRYFLELFRDYASAGILRSRILTYMQYVEGGNWEDNANGQAFPAVLFICPREKLKKHLYYFAKALFEKQFDEPFPLYLSWNERILNAKTPDVWEKVE